MSTSRAFAADAMIRVLVVDDLVVVGVLIALAWTRTAIEVVATAAHGELALSELRRNPAEVVVLDIEMPVMDGLTALDYILKQFPAVRVIMASALTLRNAEIGMKALQRGASDYISKPDGGLANAEEFKRELVSKVKALGGRPRGPASPQPVARRPVAATNYRASRVRPTVVAIGASTGGPPALLKLFESLKGAVPSRSCPPSTCRPTLRPCSPSS